MASRLKWRPSLPLPSKFLSNTQWRTGTRSRKISQPERAIEEWKLDKDIAWSRGGVREKPGWQSLIQRLTQFILRRQHSLAEWRAGGRLKTCCSARLQVVTRLRFAHWRITRS